MEEINLFVAGFFVLLDDDSFFFFFLIIVFFLLLLLLCVVFDVELFCCKVELLDVTAFPNDEIVEEVALLVVNVN